MKRKGILRRADVSQNLYLRTVLCRNGGIPGCYGDEYVYHVGRVIIFPYQIRICSKCIQVDSAKLVFSKFIAVLMEGQMIFLFSSDDVHSFNTYNMIMTRHADKQKKKRHSKSIEMI